jgi:hypothetical protein
MFQRSTNRWTMWTYPPANPLYQPPHPRPIQSSHLKPTPLISSTMKLSPLQRHYTNTPQWKTSNTEMNLFVNSIVPRTVISNHSYRRGFTNPKDDPIPSPHVFQLDDSSDLAFPSDIQKALTHESTAPPKHWSIADLAEEDPSIPQSKSRKDILGTVPLLR